MVDDVGVLEPELEEEAIGEEAGGVVVEERPRFRDRLGKARAALTGALVGVRGRAGIDDDTWDELEEALLRADVGVGVTDSLLDDLKGRVRTKEITEPDQLLEQLKLDMKDQLAGLDRELHLAAWSRGLAERVALRRGERGRQDDDHRQGGRAAGGRRATRGDGGGRHLPCRGGRAARDVGGAGRRGLRAGERGRRPRAR